MLMIFFKEDVMTKNEIVQIMAIITAAYPRFYEARAET